MTMKTMDYSRIEKSCHFLQFLHYQKLQELDLLAIVGSLVSPIKKDYLTNINTNIVIKHILLVYVYLKIYKNACAELCKYYSFINMKFITY